MSGKYSPGTALFGGVARNNVLGGRAQDLPQLLHIN